MKQVGIVFSFSIVTYIQVKWLPEQKKKEKKKSNVGLDFDVGIYLIVRSLWFSIALISCEW